MEGPLKAPEPTNVLTDSKIEQIQKLLARGSSSNEVEARLALAKAQTLMTQYNLDYATIQDAAITINDAREKVPVDRSARYKYQRMLWSALAEANYCWHSTMVDMPVRKALPAVDAPVEDYVAFRAAQQVRGKKRHVILGRRSNVTTVKLMGEYLEDTMARMCQGMGGASAITAWKSGCVDRLIERIQENKVSDIAATGTGNELILKSLADREFAANYDFTRGNGAYAQKLLKDAEWEAGQAERDRRAQEYEAAREKEWLEYLQSETPEQKAQRERRDATAARAEYRRDSRYTGIRDHQRWAGERRKEAERVGNEHYQAGAGAGATISLARQVKERKRKELTA